MSNVGVWTAQSNVEPVSTATIGGIANIANYAIVSGCAPTYSAANLNVTVASGAIIYGGVYTAVAGASVTLVADPTNPRWSWVGINSSGTPTLVSGTAAATPSVPDVGNMVPVTLVYVNAALTIADNATYKLDKRVFAPAGGVPAGGIVTNYKSATQVFTTNTTLADVTGAKGSTFSFSIGANEVWEVEYWIPLAFGGTGGAKFQITGPAAPTAVTIGGWYGGGDPAAGGQAVVGTITNVSAFSSDVNARNSEPAVSGIQTYANNVQSFIRIVATIANGANAGTVTLQAAQNSSNSTTTLGVGSKMRATRMI